MHDPKDEVTATEETEPPSPANVTKGHKMTPEQEKDWDHMVTSED